MIGVAMNWEFTAEVEDKEEWMDQLRRSRLIDQACVVCYGIEVHGYLHTRRAVSAARIYAEANMIGGQRMLEKRHVKPKLGELVKSGSVEVIKCMSVRYQRYLDEAIYSETKGAQAETKLVAIEE